MAESREQEAPVGIATTKDVEGDVTMPDVDAPVPAVTRQVEEQQSQPIPPPPSGPLPVASPPPALQDHQSAISDQSESQKHLLPPIENRLKGRKCLVLDLDETLVHSSFKVRDLRQILPARRFY